jgi:hypothetical protein
MKQRIRRFITFLASTVFIMALVFAASASAITRNQAEGLANAQTSKDCGSFLYSCVHEDLTECHDTGTDQRGVVQWWCSEVYVEKNKITGNERAASRALGYGPYGGNPLVAGPFDYTPIGGGA